MLCFLSGLPRSGSTLLGSLLSQRDDIFVSATSGLIDIMGASAITWEQNPTTKAGDLNKEELIRILRSMADAKYADKKFPIIIDKSRGWPAPQIMNTMEKVLGRPPKIIATVRPVAQCLASFVKLTKPKDVKEFCRKDALSAHLFASYQMLKAGWEAAPSNFLFVEYDDLVKNPQKELDRVADFLGVKRFTHHFENIQNPLKEKDEEAWNIPGLHDIRPSVKKAEYDGRALLGDIWDQYQGGEFWSNKPEPKKEKQLLDLQLEAGMHGNFEEGWKIAQQLERERPQDDRAAFNRGWYLLRQGKLQEGHKLLDRGRNDGIFGNPHIGTPQPIWNGESVGYVLVNLEGSIGSQIHGVRFAKYIAGRGNRVVTSCSAELVKLLASIKDVSAVVQHEAAMGAYHDAWIPSMSAVIPLGYEFIDLDGSPYIQSTEILPKSSRKKIGLFWKESKNLDDKEDFPAKMLFDSLKNLDADFISFQKNEDAIPDWIKITDANNWIDLSKQLASCDLLITSDSDIAHLSGAMGIKTWIVLPLLCSYLWAFPGERSPYYNTVLLFRQQKFGKWDEPFRELQEKLKTL